MSIGWWSRKLEGGYVWHKESQRFCRVMAISTAQTLDTVWPEDVANTLELVFEDDTRAGLGEVEFRFPADGYRVYTSIEDGPRLLYGERDAHRNRWRLVPTNETYSVYPVDRSIRDWLNGAEPEVVSRTEISQWKNESEMYHGALLVSRRDGPFRRNIYYAEKLILALDRSPTEVVLRRATPTVPAYLLEGWGLEVDQPQPYNRMSPTNRKLYETEGAPPPRLGAFSQQTTYDWVQVDDDPADFEYYLHTGPVMTIAGPRIRRLITIGYQDEAYVLQADEDLTDLFDDPHVTNDVQILLLNHLHGEPL